MRQLPSSIPSLIPEAMIAERIRGEFREMPGLVLTAAQACRLWSLDVSICHATLTQLVEAGFLCSNPNGSYARASDLTVQPRMAKPGIQFIELEPAHHPAIAER